VTDISDSALTRMRARVEPIIARTCHYLSPVTNGPGRHFPLMGAFIAPAARFDVMGLIPILNGAAVLALTNVTATMRRPSGAVLSYRRSEQSGAVLLSMSGAEARGRA
jgi:hypothetical protein